MALRAIGHLIQADENGILPRIGRRPDPSWTAILEDVIEQRQNRDCAIILRGSVARGASVKDAADLDLVILHGDQILPTQPLQSRTMPDLSIETTYIHHQAFEHHKRWAWMRFMLAHNGYTIFGPDKLSNLPAPQLGRHSYAHLPNADKWLKQWQVYWAEDAAHKDICQWTMKRIIRALFESQMMALNAYSRDIYPCAMAAIDAFPHMEAAIMQAAELAIAPTTDHHLISEITSNLTPLLHSQQANLT